MELMAMTTKDFPTVLEIKDPVHGYVHLSQTEKALLDLRAVQRLRGIKTPAGIFLVFPGADCTLLGSLLGSLYVTETFFHYLDGELEDILRARISTILLKIASGPWSNVMEEYLTTRGFDKKRLIRLILEDSVVGDVIQNSEFSKDELISYIDSGVPLRGLKVDLQTIPINPGLIDSLLRDAYFAGVEYAQIEFHRLFTQTRIVKNRLAFVRSSLFTLEAYLSAAMTMYDAVYFHKTVRAAELMLLRMLEEGGSHFLPSLPTDVAMFLDTDDITYHYELLTVDENAPEGLRNARDLFTAFVRRYLPKVASMRSISNPEFFEKVSTIDGLYKLECEIAEDAGIDPRNVYVDFPDRASVYYHPGKFSLHDLFLFERGTRGYEFWRVSEMSEIARTFNRLMWPVRVYTTRGYRSRVKRSADRLLESFDQSGITD